MTTYAPAELVITTSGPFTDDVLIARSGQRPAIAFIQISTSDGHTGDAFLTLAETIAVRNQLDAIIDDYRPGR
jgi:hypothetical protein